MYSNMHDAVSICSPIYDVLTWYNYWQIDGKLEASTTT